MTSVWKKETYVDVATIVSSSTCSQKRPFAKFYSVFQNVRSLVFSLFKFIFCLLMSHALAFHKNVNNHYH